MRAAIRDMWRQYSELAEVPHHGPIDGWISSCSFVARQLSMNHQVGDQLAKLGCERLHTVQAERSALITETAEPVRAQRCGPDVGSAEVGSP